MKRPAATALVAGLAFAAAGCGATARRSDGFAPSARLGGVVAQVRRGFGDGRIVSASLDGSRLSVQLALGAGSGDAAQMKGVFEAQVLGHAVADWMRARGRKPIATVQYRDGRGRLIRGYLAGGDPVETDPDVSQERAGACRKAAERAVTGLLTLASARTLPYLHGTCVFILRTTKPRAGSQAAAGALERMIQAIGPPNERPWFFELVTRGGSAISSAAWLPGDGGTTWARPGYAYALAHG